MHIMKDPEDLDLSSEDQADLTRLIEEHKDKGGSVDNLLLNCMTASSEVDTILTHYPLSAWHRAVFELAQKQKREPHIAAETVLSIMWLHVEFMQKAYELTMKQIDNPELIEAMRKQGFPWPTKPPPKAG